ncbi:uncharacterized protein CLUP02_13488 [Colletotrichum lupini]|uniref:Uncharacterized protein n=1 Tax=Colletotrichum lupini TaxID=145971 RepID=A0A9Q8WM71_9PEZI|nr:uncharacterized protein CLUP02_13488 [Colletotrichum lupini]UQC87967.1 hypothetical protein CLUP02_13488 [Colletotrichum lupini]
MLNKPCPSSVPVYTATTSESVPFLFLFLTPRPLSLSVVVKFSSNSNIVGNSFLQNPGTTNKAHFDWDEGILRPKSGSVLPLQGQNPPQNSVGNSGTCGKFSRSSIEIGVKISLRIFPCLSGTQQPVTNQHMEIHEAGVSGNQLVLSHELSLSHSHLSRFSPTKNGCGNSIVIPGPTKCTSSIFLLPVSRPRVWSTLLCAIVGTHNTPDGVPTAGTRSGYHRLVQWKKKHQEIERNWSSRKYGEMRISELPERRASPSPSRFSVLASIVQMQRRIERVPVTGSRGPVPTRRKSWRQCTLPVHERAAASRLSVNTVPCFTSHERVVTYAVQEITSSVITDGCPTARSTIVRRTHAAAGSCTRRKRGLNTKVLAPTSSRGKPIPICPVPALSIKFRSGTEAPGEASLRPRNKESVCSRALTRCKPRSRQYFTIIEDKMDFFFFPPNLAETCLVGPNKTWRAPPRLRPRTSVSQEFGPRFNSPGSSLQLCFFLHDGRISRRRKAVTATVETSSHTEDPCFASLHRVTRRSNAENTETHHLIKMIPSENPVLAPGLETWRLWEVNSALRLTYLGPYAIDSFAPYFCHMVTIFSSALHPPDRAHAIHRSIELQEQEMRNLGYGVGVAIVWGCREPGANHPLMTGRQIDEACHDRTSPESPAPLTPTISDEKRTVGDTRREQPISTMIGQRPVCPSVVYGFNRRPPRSKGDCSADSVPGDEYQKMRREWHRWFEWLKRFMRLMSLCPETWSLSSSGIKVLELSPVKTDDPKYPDSWTPRRPPFAACSIIFETCRNAAAVGQLPQRKSLASIFPWGRGLKRGQRQHDSVDLLDNVATVHGICRQTNSTMNWGYCGWRVVPIHLQWQSCCDGDIIARLEVTDKILAPSMIARNPVLCLLRARLWSRAAASSTDPKYTRCPAGVFSEAIDVSLKTLLLGSLGIVLLVKRGPQLIASSLRFVVDTRCATQAPKSVHRSPPPPPRMMTKWPPKELGKHRGVRSVGSVHRISHVVLGKGPADGQQPTPDDHTTPWTPSNRDLFERASEPLAAADVYCVRPDLPQAQVFLLIRLSAETGCELQIVREPRTHSRSLIDVGSTQPIAGQLNSAGLAVGTRGKLATDSEKASVVLLYSNLSSPAARDNVAGHLQVTDNVPYLPEEVFNKRRFAFSPTPYDAAVVAVMVTHLRDPPRTPRCPESPSAEHVKKRVPLRRANPELGLRQNARTSRSNGREGRRFTDSVDSFVRSLDKGHRRWFTVSSASFSATPMARKTGCCAITAPTIVHTLILPSTHGSAWSCVLKAGGLHF